MAWMETDYSKHTHCRWKIKWRLEHLGALGIMGETAPLMYHTLDKKIKNPVQTCSNSCNCNIDSNRGLRLLGLDCTKLGT